MKNVIFLSSSNINAQNGAAKFARLLLSKPDTWEKSGFKLSSSTNSNTFTNDEEYRKTLKFHIKKSIRRFLGTTRIGKRIRFFNYYVGMLSKWPVDKIKDIIQADDIVILNDSNVAWNFYEKYGISHKSIFLMHNSGDFFSMAEDEMKDPQIKKFLLNSEKVILRNATVIVFVSEVARVFFISKHPEYKDKCKTIYIGMDPFMKPKEERNDNIIKFVTVGTVCERKNQILAVEAFDSLKKYPISLSVVGGGDELKRCKQYVSEHQIENIVSFEGPTNDVESCLAQSDVFIMTSKDEGLPVAAQEAMAMGLPLILTDVGGCKELVVNNGIVINPNIDEVKKAIMYFVEHPEIIKEWGKNSKKVFNSKFSLERMTDEYINVAKELCN